MSKFTLFLFFCVMSYVYSITYPCTEAGLDSAIAAGGYAEFDCTVKTNITISSEKVLQSDTTINGNNLFFIVVPSNVRDGFVIDREVYFNLTNSGVDGGYSINNWRGYGTVVIQNSRIVSNARAITNAFGTTIVSNSVVTSTVNDQCIYSFNVTVTSSLLHHCAVAVNCWNNGSVRIEHSTVTDVGTMAFQNGNVAPDKSNVYYRSSIISVWQLSSVDLVTHTSLGYNVFKGVDASKIMGDTSTDQMNVNPKLKNVGIYGTDRMETAPPSEDSPVINAGPTSSPVAMDQVGNPRVLNGAADIGAIETYLKPMIIVSNATVNETNAEPKVMLVQVSISSPSTIAVNVAWTTISGTAIAGQDYVEASGSLTFANPITPQFINVTILGDNVPEQTEYFSIFFSSNEAESKTVNYYINDAPITTTGTTGTTGSTGTTGTTGSTGTTGDAGTTGTPATTGVIITGTTGTPELPTTTSTPTTGASTTADSSTTSVAGTTSSASTSTTGTPSIASESSEKKGGNVLAGAITGVMIGCCLLVILFILVRKRVVNKKDNIEEAQLTDYAQEDNDHDRANNDNVKLDE